MIHFRFIHRSMRLLILVIRFMLHLSIGTILIKAQDRMSWRISTTSKYCRQALNVLSINTTIIGKEHLCHSALVVANHISYTDVLLLSSALPAVFISTVEVGQSPLLGQLTHLAGGLFIERRVRSRIGPETDLIAAALRSGQRLVVFPEGTTGDGRALLPFKTPLFASAARAKVPIQPVCIRYNELNGHKMTTTERKDPIVFDGNMVFFSHLVGLLHRIKNASACIHILPPIHLTRPEDRKAVAAAVHTRMCDVLDLSPAA